jgi:Acetyltransferase (GNAT) family
MKMDHPILSLNKVARFLTLLKNRQYRSVWFRLTSFLPFFGVAYDRFYLVRCVRINVPHLPPLKSGPQLTIADYSREAVEEIKRHLPSLNTNIIDFQMACRPDDARIVRIDKRGRCVAVCFTVKTTSIKSPSGYAISIARGGPVTWVFGTYIHEHFRVRGYLPHLLNTAFQISRENGSTGLMGEIHHMNVASIISHAKFGFTVFQDVQYVKIGPWKHFWKSSADFWCLPKKLA